jgi:hypothetical protein
MGTRLNRNEMEKLRDAKRSRHFLRLASSQTVNYEFLGQYGHPSSYAFVKFECAPADDLSFESRATWPSTILAGEQARFEVAVAEAVADVLFEGVYQHSGCTVVLTDVRYDEVVSSEAAFMKAAKGAMQGLLATEWKFVNRSQTTDIL